ncbi:hypothetical protein MC885_000911, partial [Smutsia gigantea]
MPPGGDEKQMSLQVQAAILPSPLAPPVPRRSCRCRKSNHGPTATGIGNSFWIPKPLEFLCNTWSEDGTEAECNRRTCHCPAGVGGPGVSSPATGLQGPLLRALSRPQALNFYQP